MAQNLSAYFKLTNETDTTFKKIDRANLQVTEAQKKIVQALQDANKTKYDVNNINDLGKEAYDMADQMNKDAEELAQLMAD